MPEKTRLEYKKFAAWIEVDGKELTCYAPDLNKKEKHISCWIASEEGKNFTIKVRKGKTKADCRISAHVDGKQIGRNHCERKKICWIRYDSLRTSSTIQRLIMFAPLQTTDEDNADSAVFLSESAKELGKISLKIHRITGLNTVQCTRKKTESECVPVPLKVPESSTKAADMPHQVAFGEQRNKNTSEFRATCDVHELLATFVFRYRPLRVLRSCGIVRGEPAPPNIVVLRGESSLTGGLSTGIAQIEVPVRPEDPDDMHPPEALQPLENSTVPSSVVSPPDLENQAEVPPKQEEDKPDISDDDDDEVTKVLMAEVEKRRNEKRKAKEAAGAERKRIKQEAEVLTFFKPGEIPEVIDLT